jgi:hypothetical protein
MKTSLKEAIASVLIDLGVNTVTNVPGYGGSEVFDVYNELANKKITNLVSRGSCLYRCSWFIDCRKKICSFNEGAWYC